MDLDGNFQSENVSQVLESGIIWEEEASDLEKGLCGEGGGGKKGAVKCYHFVPCGIKISFRRVMDKG